MKFIILLLFISFCNGASANQIWTNDKLHTMYIEPATVVAGEGNFLNSSIKFCKWRNGGNECETLPQNMTSLDGFRGTLPDWGYFFNRCKNFDHVNTLTDVSLVVGTLVALPGLGFWKTLTAEVGVGFVGGAPYSDTPDQVLEVKADEAELLEISSEAIVATALDVSAQMVYFLLKNERKSPRVPAKYLLALSDIIKVCSQGFRQDYQNRNARTCLGSCHSMPSDYEQPKGPEEFSYDRTFPINRDGHSSNDSVKELSEYLDSVSSQ